MMPSEPRALSDSTQRMWLVHLFRRPNDPVCLERSANIAWLAQRLQERRLIVDPRFEPELRFVELRIATIRRWVTEQPVLPRVLVPYGFMFEKRWLSSKGALPTLHPDTSETTASRKRPKAPTDAIEGRHWVVSGTALSLSLANTRVLVPDPCAAAAFASSSFKSWMFTVLQGA